MGVRHDHPLLIKAGFHPLDNLIIGRPIVGICRPHADKIGDHAVAIAFDVNLGLNVRENKGKVDSVFQRGLDRFDGTVIG